MRFVAMLALLCLLWTPNVALAGKKDEAPAAGWRVAEDPSHDACCAKDKNRWFPVIDGAPVDARYDAIVAGAPTWLDDSTLEFLGFRGGKPIRVRLSHGGD